MRLFLYYVLHTFKNQLKKLFKTWVFVFFAVCVAIGVIVGLVAAIMSEHAEPLPQPDVPELGENIVDYDDGQGEIYQDDNPIEQSREVSDIVELTAGAIIVFIIVAMTLSADKSNIFLPADALLFASPVKPQSVLFFRLSTRLGLVLLTGLYMLFQLPNLFNMGLGLWPALAIILAWPVTVAIATLLQTLLYLVYSAYPKTKNIIWRVIILVALAIAVGYILALRANGNDAFQAAVKFFNSDISRFIPIWGWLKGFCRFAADSNVPAAVISFTAVIASAALLIFAIYRIKADFYEDALAKTELAAQALEKAKSEKSSGFAVVRTKERSSKLRRDGLNHGRGAGVIFFKALYNRFRFAHLGIFTKTSELYLAAAIITGLICRFALGGTSSIPVAAVLAVAVFIRTLGNPLEQDVKTDMFLMMPSPPSYKLWASAAGGSLNCLLDIILPLILGSAVCGANPLTALVWLIPILSLDLYATSVNTFILLSVPVKAGNTLKQTVAIMFVYFGLLPDIGIMAASHLSGHMFTGVIIASLFNVALGALFLGWSARFVQPGSLEVMLPFGQKLKTVRKCFSRSCLAVIAVLLIASVLQICLMLITRLITHDFAPNGIAYWLITFLPTYAAILLGSLIFRKLPGNPPEKKSFKIHKLLCAVAICFFMMYAGNMLGTVVVSLLQSLSGQTAVNPILSYADDGNLVVKLIFFVVLSPLAEEFLFRKQILDRTSQYGKKLSIVFSALTFALFHGNLSQFFYAFTIGLVLGYVYLETGRLRYSLILHMAINLSGGVIAPLMLEISQNQTIPWALLAYSAAVVLLAVAGCVLLCLNAKKLRFEPAQRELPKGMRAKTAFANPGFVILSLIFLISSAAMFASQV